MKAALLALLLANKAKPKPFVDEAGFQDVYGTHGRKSVVWLYFLLNLKTKLTKCTLCGRVFCNRNGTKGLKGHLENRHPGIDLEKDESPAVRIPLMQVSTESPNQPPNKRQKLSSTPGTPRKTPNKTGNTPINRVFRRVTPAALRGDNYEKSGNSMASLDELLAKLCTGPERLSHIQNSERRKVLKQKLHLYRESRYVL